MKRRRISKVDQVHERAMILARDLKRAREDGKITPSNTRRGRSIAEALNKFHKWDPPLSGDAGVRELVNHCRSLGLPVIGDGNGYAWGVHSSEVIPTIADLKSRIARMSQALHGLEKCAANMEQTESEIFRTVPENQLSPEKIVKILEGEPDK